VPGIHRPPADNSPIPKSLKSHRMPHAPRPQPKRIHVQLVKLHVSTASSLSVSHQALR
jgi:hypothetical protein